MSNYLMNHVLIKDSLEDEFRLMDIIEAGWGRGVLEYQFPSSKSHLYGHRITRGKRP